PAIGAVGERDGAGVLKAAIDLIEQMRVGDWGGPHARRLRGADAELAIGVFSPAVRVEIDGDAAGMHEPHGDLSPVKRAGYENGPEAGGSGPVAELAIVIDAPAVRQAVRVGDAKGVKPG